MPVKIKKKDGKYSVSTPGGTKAKGTTKTKAEAQARLLQGIEHGMVPRKKKRATKRQEGGPVRRSLRQVAAEEFDKRRGETSSRASDRPRSMGPGRSDTSSPTSRSRKRSAEYGMYYQEAPVKLLGREGKSFLAGEKETSSRRPTTEERAKGGKVKKTAKRKPVVKKKTTKKG